MKGAVFNLFEDFITETFSEDVYESILDGVELQTKEPFVGPKTYPFDDFLALVGEACRLANLSVADASRAFGEYCFPKLFGSLPESMRNYQSPRSLIEAVEGIIHVEVKKLYSDVELQLLSTRTLVLNCWFTTIRKTSFVFSWKASSKAAPLISIQK